MNKQVLIRPIITEKSLKLANTQSCFTFEVGATANKDQIKTAVGQAFDVNVRRVRTVSAQATTRRTGKRRVKKSVPRKKKALVYLSEGQTIDLFDLGGDE